MFLVCGEILYDLFTEDRSESSLGFEARPGGSPFNVAVGLARLGHPVTFAGAVSTDLLGERLVRTLQQENVGTGLLVRKPKPTTLSFVGLDQNGNADYAFYGENAADRDFRSEDIRVIPDGVKAIHIGSFSAVVEPIATTIAALVRAERNRRLISYDANVRLNVLSDAARWREKIESLAPHVHILKMSADDLGHAYPGQSAARCVERFIAAGTRLVIVTSAGAGAFAWTDREHVHVPAPAIEVVDTVGAGDSFQAGFLAAFADRDFLSRERISTIDSETLRHVMTAAARSSAFTCMRRGAQLPARAELHAITGR